MRPGAEPHRRTSPWRSHIRDVYVVVVAAAGLSLVAALLYLHGFRVDTLSVVFVGLSVLSSFSRLVAVESLVYLGLASVITAGAMALLPAAEAGVVGLICGFLLVGGVPLRFKLFNASQTAVYTVAGVTTFGALGGRVDSTIQGTGEILLSIGWPYAVASLVQMSINLALMVVLGRLGNGPPMRTQAAQLLRSTGLSYVGYGVIAFLLVVLWEPAGLGPAAVVLVLAPLLVARWAYGQIADEVRGQGDALGVLAATVEAKAPHLAGHSARVADLSARLAGHLGLRSQQVTDARMAGMLHDLGQTTLPTALVRENLPSAPGEMATYPVRGAQLLGDLDFLAGSLGAIVDHRSAVEPGGRHGHHGPLASIVGVADEYDLLTEVGAPDGLALSHTRAVERLRALDADGEVLEALEAIRGRVSGDGPRGDS